MNIFLTPCPFCHAEPQVVRREYATVVMWGVKCTSQKLSEDNLILCQEGVLLRADLMDAAARWCGMERAEYEEMCRELEP